MKKRYIPVALMLLAGSSLTFTSCIGSFGLTKSVVEWNQQVGSKFVNEVVFFAFWILPVYEVTSIADIFILNSIEFWSGKNPMEASTRVIPSDHGNYLVKCDGKGYTITNEISGSEMRLDFDEESQTWSYNDNGTLHPFMSFIDDNHVKMIMPDGQFRAVDLSEQGVLAYSKIAMDSQPTLAFL